jgi:hypothetical protein
LNGSATPVIPPPGAPVTALDKPWIEADPADVADQRRVLPLPEDELDLGAWT